jgi:hypothetical protein
VHVRVDQTRQQRAPAEVHHPGVVHRGGVVQHVDARVALLEALHGPRHPRALAPKRGGGAAGKGQPRGATRGAPKHWLAAHLEGGG